MKLKFRGGLLIIMFFLLLNCLCNDGDVKQIDKYVDNVSLTSYETVDELLKNLIVKEWNEKEKCRAIFYWIASNIEYDKEGFKNGYWNKYTSYDELALKTYSLGKGICGGYSHLFKYMCDKSGIEAKVIDGFSRTEFYQAGLPIENPNHSWNAIKLNDKWKLIDITWASSTAKESKSNDFYYLTPPIKFITNHFPVEENWQMLKEPVTKDEFDEYPYISSNYFKLHVTNHYPKKGKIEQSADTFRLSLDTLHKYSPLIKLFSYEKKEWLPVDYTKKDITSKQILDICINDNGRYLLRVDYLENRESGIKIYKEVLGYTIIKN